MDQRRARSLNLSSSISQTIDFAKQWLERRQDGRGFWVGRLESNSSMEAEWILAMHLLGVENDPKYDGVVEAILRRQRRDGSWEVFHEAPEGDISTTVECYAALRCAGIPAGAAELTRARDWIFRHGGFKNVRVFTRIWLALIGEWPWYGTPQLPPELILLPAPWFPFNIYHFSSWARATIVPLSIISSKRPVKPLPPGRRLDELFPNGRDAVDYRLPRQFGWLSWEGFFLTVDRLLWKYSGLPYKPLRKLAVSLCLEWILRHQDADGAWGGIQPPTIYSLMALHACGYALDHPAVAKALDSFNEPCAVREGDAIFLQASNSPVWDTLLTLQAYLECGISPRDSDVLQRALHWVLREEIRSPGDWQVMVPGVEPSGWAFEYENNAYPDCDDTAVAVQVLARLRASGAVDCPEELSEAIGRATRWLMAMQSSCGGWASFDKDNNHVLLTKIPFCDFGEVLDPPSVDVTAHILEGLGYLGRGVSDPAADRAIRYILSEQESDGSWFGRWGVNYIYGTSAVLTGLRSIGFDMSDKRILAAAAWLAGRQNRDGGWGEGCSSYMDDRSRGVGPSSASQTAWAVLGLLSVPGGRYQESAVKGVEFLVRTQTSDGTWDEPQYTGTGFPGYGLGRRAVSPRTTSALPQGPELSRGFMLNYNMYRHYFPLMALGRARQSLGMAVETAREAASAKG